MDNETDNLFRVFKITCKLCGSKIISDLDHPEYMYCPNILKMDETRCRNDYSITYEELRVGTYNKEMFKVVEKVF